ncbi:MAG: hypothetical protein C4586_08690 [Anaerolineaceae bacterium]|nr:MAG: hypothetical protein C4586_08690 [Anaerolineaceae bacterium]
MIKITDRRSILKQVISGICWSPVALIGLFIAALVGLMAYGITITILGGGLLKVIIGLAKSAGIMAVVFGYIIAFIWSNQN